MKLSRLRRASDIEVNQWLDKELELTPYQREKLRNRQITRLGKYYFYEYEKKMGTNILWRLSIIPFIVYAILITCFLPIYFIISGNWGYGRKFMDKFHAPWVRKIGFL